MTGSSRLGSTDTHSVRAPYSAPQTTAPSTLPPTRNFDPDTGAAIRFPAPFIPREFRALVRVDVTVLPDAEQVSGNHVSQLESAATPTPTSIALLFNDDAAPASDFASFIESHATDESETSAAAELPWIDAFTEDASEPEESWPLGEAGKRLDELTQSLSSLDASRERQQAERVGAAEAAPVEAALPMWNEEEWIDIMPTAPADVISRGELSLDCDEAMPEVQAGNVPTAPLNAESAARALEGLAQRVRAGELRVPAFPTELGQEAMLAGLLASMLGWRQ